VRRAAIGTVQPLIEHDLDFDLRTAVAQAAKLQPIEVSGEMQEQVLEFIAGRLSVLLKETYRYDVVDAVLAARSSNPAGAARAVKGLQDWVQREDWNEILPAYARCVRITRDQGSVFKVHPDLLAEEAEGKLFAAVDALPSSFEDVHSFLNAVVTLIPAINEFFDKVLVMAEEQPIRENRLGLVQRIASMADGIADLSKLEGF
jgi:glycyl-tRNA synthetase